MGKKESIKIYVFHYKNGKAFPGYSSYQHIWAGKNQASEASELTGDDTGDHISAKNKYYSELTGIYWVWKNQHSDVVGTCHYRRFFTNAATPLSHRLKQKLYFLLGLQKKREGLIYTNNSEYWENKLLNEADVREILKEYDAILPQPRTLKYTVQEHYSRYHNTSDLPLLRTILEELQPEYTATFDVVLTQKHLYANNMFVLRRKNFEQLALWLFSILNEFENRVDLANYTEYQQRLFGFLSERLITIWFAHHSLKIKEAPLVYLKQLKKND